MVGADLADIRVFGEVANADVGLPEFHVHGQVVQPQRLLGVVLELLGVGAVVVGQVGVEPVEVVPVDVQGLALGGVLLGEFADVVPVIVPVELLEGVYQLGVVRAGH